MLQRHGERTAILDCVDQRVVGDPEAEGGAKLARVLARSGSLDSPGTVVQRRIADQAPVGVKEAVVLDDGTDAAVDLMDTDRQDAARDWWPPRPPSRN